MTHELHQPSDDFSRDQDRDLNRDLNPGVAAFRAAVGRAMDSTAPTPIRSRVQSLLRNAPGSRRHGVADSLAINDGATGPGGPGTGGTGTGGTGAGGTASSRKGSWTKGPAHPNAFAVAASLMLVAGAVLFGIFGPRIGTRIETTTATTVAEVAAVVVDEHEQCTVHDSCSMQRAPWRSPAEASRELSRLLHRELRIPDLESAGFSFCCGSQTTIPGAGAQSGHLLYCRMEGDSCAWLSVFVAPVETRYLASDSLGRTGPLDCGIHYYRFLAPNAGEIFYFCDGVVTWFVKPSDPADFEIVRHFFPDAF
jgi:hypothetical protein